MYVFVTRFVASTLFVSSAIAQPVQWSPKQADVNPEVVGQILDQADRRFNQEKDTRKARVDGVLSQAGNLAQLASQEGKLLAYQLRTGTHNVKSDNGELIVYSVQTILKGPGKNEKEFKESLRNFNQWVEQGRPEALNALGFFVEYGLVGQQKDTSQALALYRRAAASGYQAAIYNLGIAAAYGKGQSKDISSAVNYLSAANSAGHEASGRVCGMGSFLAYTLKNKAASIRMATSCSSPLAKLPLALWADGLNTQQRFELAKSSLSAGIDDGYNAMKSIALNTITQDNQLLYCKAYFLSALAKSPRQDISKKDAEECVNWTFSKMNKPGNPSMMSTGISAVMAFPRQTMTETEVARRSNRSHFSWSVPFLPFTHSDVLDMEASIK